MMFYNNVILLLYNMVMKICISNKDKCIDNDE